MTLGERFGVDMQRFAIGPIQKTGTSKFELIELL